MRCFLRENMFESVEGVGQSLQAIVFWFVEHSLQSQFASTSNGQYKHVLQKSRCREVSRWVAAAEGKTLDHPRSRHSPHSMSNDAGLRMKLNMLCRFMEECCSESEVPYLGIELEVENRNELSICIY